MTVSVTRHDVAPDAQNDPSHPVPYLGVIDVAGYRSTGGASLKIIVASALDASERSKTRLLDKIQGYLAHISSPQFRSEAGSDPTPENTTIEVLLHPESSLEIHKLLERCHEWVRSNHACLVVRELSGGDT
jgi:hypothetical protein